MKKYFVLLVLLFIFSDNVFAAADGMTGLKGVGHRIGLVVVNWKPVLIIAAGFLGVCLIIVSGLQLKKYADNPHQNSLAKPLITMIAGVIIFGICATSITLMDTVFGDGTFEETRHGGFSRDFLDAGTNQLF